MSQRKYSKRQLKKAHFFSNNHKPELERDSVCGCFDCLAVFRPKEITEWLIEKTPADWRGTAICPYCGIDSVIGESSGFPITQEFLAAMHEYWVSPINLADSKNKEGDIT